MNQLVPKNKFQGSSVYIYTCIYLLLLSSAFCLHAVVVIFSCCFYVYTEKKIVFSNFSKVKLKSANNFIKSIEVRQMLILYGRFLHSGHSTCTSNFCLVTPTGVKMNKRYSGNSNK